MGQSLVSNKYSRASSLGWEVVGVILATGFGAELLVIDVWLNQGLTLKRRVTTKSNAVSFVADVVYYALFGLAGAHGVGKSSTLRVVFHACLALRSLRMAMAISLLKEGKKLFETLFKVAPAIGALMLVWL